jgi:hypothetical protein
MLSPSFTGTIIIRFLSPPFFLACKGRNFFSKKRLYSKIISNFAPLSVEGTISSIASLAG